MSLMTLGRSSVAADRVEAAAKASTVSDEDKKKLEEARKSLLATLTPWIPGDFVVTYGVLLTAWDDLRASFRWLLLVAIASAFVFVVGAAFAEDGFTKTTKRSARQLAVRTVAGAGISVIAAVAIPNSGWYDFKNFRDNELGWIVTVGGLGVAALLFFLKGAQKRWSIQLENT